jgi:hypothetical protein
VRAASGPGDPVAYLLGNLAFGVGGGLILGSMSSAALIHATFRVLRNEAVTVAESLRVAVRRFLAVVGVGLLWGIGITTGCCFFVVPGGILAAGLFVAAPAVVVERCSPLAALDRSWNLTRGYRWAAFFLFLAAYAPILLLGFLTGLLDDGASRGEVGWVSVAFAVVGIPLGMFLATAQAVVYHELRRAKEGLGDEELAAVFE